ncbi:enhancer of filamentation 1 isoform X2 [Scleropages formosus]|uniref:enhancer of filamentation 1 isoform X2 n=1 Tax=Scleropages formosus TaxID=113540 RepID=UPI0010FAC2B7|nr:enhancer of filamentation 1 isoform X2 [Scleropages formosus]
MITVTHGSGSKGAMARALYDNVPESPEELAFRKGDILTVIEQNTGGLEGWWLCSLHGRQGIAPGNRLKLLVGPGCEAPSPHPANHLQGPGKQDGLYQVPLGKEVYQVPQPTGRATGATDATPDKVLTPVRVGQSYAFDQSPGVQQDLYDVPPVRTQEVYDIPPSQQVGSVLPRQLGTLRSQGVYDIPPAVRGVYSVPPSHSSPAPPERCYDFPQPFQPQPGGIYDVPSTVLAHVHPDVSLKKGSSGSSSSSGSCVYDVPPTQQSAGGHRDVYDMPRGARFSQPRGPQPLGDVLDGVRHLSLAGEVEPAREQAFDPVVQQVAGPLQSANAAVQVLLGLAASPCWRTGPFMEQHDAELRGAADSLCAALADLLLLGRGALGGAAALLEPSLRDRLRQQLQRLDDSLRITQQSSRTLDSASWAPPVPPGSRDDLDRLLVVCRGVSDDIRQLAATFAAGGDLLFGSVVLPEAKQEWGPTRPFPLPWDTQQETLSGASPERCVKSWMEDYDYVHLQGKEEFERQQQELLEKENILKQNKIQLEEEQLKQYKQLEQEVIRPVENDAPEWISQQPASTGGGAALCGRDQQLLRFYSEQCSAHFATFLNAVDAFFACVGAGQPPRVFVAHSKLVILSAHKLVFIGDTLSRQVAAPQVAHRVMDGSNALCQILKTVVGATKMAALRYPNTAALQEMVDRVTLLSHQAAQFKAQLQQASGP